jgi:type IV pilus assembly protein PilN
MIKINLLGGGRAKKARKRIEIPFQMAGVIGGVVLLFGGMGFAWWYLSSTVSALTQQTVTLNQELTALKATVKEVENFEKDKKTFEEKIGIIQQLRKNQSGPVHLLEEISKSLPDRVWLVSMSEQGGKIDLDGKAVTNAEIVDFINNLKASRYMSDIQLIESRQVSEGGIPVYSFKLKCTMVL